MRLFILTASAAILISCGQVSLTPFPLEPCHLDGLAEEVRCGVHDVFEDRASRAGRRLQIQVAVLPALRRLVDPDPLFILAGGPGQGARGLGEAAARFFKKIRRTRDIVLVDLRGTGASAPIGCPVADDLSLSADAITAQIRECRDALDANPRLYTHEESLADLDEIRARLGYARINVWGGSWGTRAALLYAQRFPAATRTVVLDGAVPLDLGFPRSASTDANAALERLIADCAADQSCASAFPKPREVLRNLTARFAKGPVAATIRHPRSGASLTFTIEPGMITEIIRGALYVPRDATAVFQMAAHAANGDLAPLLAQYYRTAAWSADDMALGATYSVLCSEDLPATAGQDFSADAKGSFFGTVYADGWRGRCGEWPQGARLNLDNASVSAVPALILSGLHDPVTPPRTGDMMARYFSSSWHVVVPGAAHNASFSGCVPDLIAQFITTGGGAGLDQSCVELVKWPRFAVSDAGSRP